MADSAEAYLGDSHHRNITERSVDISTPSSVLLALTALKGVVDEVSLLATSRVFTASLTGKFALSEFAVGNRIRHRIGSRDGYEKQHGAQDGMPRYNNDDSRLPSCFRRLFTRSPAQGEFMVRLYRRRGTLTIRLPNTRASTEYAPGPSAANAPLSRIEMRR